MLYFALALAPVVFLFTFIYLRDKYEREPLRLLVITFILGVLTAFPVVMIGEKLQEITQTSADSSFWGIIFYAFIVVALTEEGMKFLVLRFFNYPNKEFNEPYDGIMYGAAVSLGFAAIENVLYVFSTPGAELQTGIVRMFTAVPAHAMFGVIMGYYVGRAKFMAGGNRTMEILLGLLAAILFHGLYDVFLFLADKGDNELTYLVLFSFVTLFIGLRLANKAIREHQENSPYR